MQYLILQLAVLLLENSQFGFVLRISKVQLELGRSTGRGICKSRQMDMVCVRICVLLG